MLLHLLNADALGWINSQYLTDEILQLDGNVARYRVLSIQNLAVQFGSVLVLEGKETAYHSEENDSSTPHIHHDGFIRRLPLNHFRSGIARRPASSPQPLLRLVSIGQSKIDNPDGLIVIDEAVLQFEIAVHNPQFMNIFDATDDLLEDLAGLLLLHPLLADDVIEELSPLHVLHHQEEMLGRLDDLI